MPANNYIVALERMMKVLEAFGGQRELPLHELAARCGLVKSSVYRVLFTLQRLGYVERNAASRYTISSRLRTIAGDPRESWDLGEIAAPFMMTLLQRFQETVNLGVLDEGEVSYVRVLESPQALRLSAHAGMRGGAHSTALGKCLLAGRTRAEVEAILKRRGMRPRTDRTIRDRAALQRELERVRTRGYALDNEEDSRGARCIGAPIRNARGEVIAALSISGPAARIRPNRDREFAQALVDVCRQISVLLGYQPEAQAVGQSGEGK